MTAHTLQEGLALQQRGELTQAQSIYEAILKQYPNNIDALYLLGTVYHLNQDHKQAIRYLIKALHYAPTNQKICHNLARIYLADQQPEHSIRLIKKLLDTTKEDSTLLHDLGTAFLESGEYHKAINAFCRVLVNNPEHLDTHYNLGRSYYLLDQVSKAIPYFQFVIEQDPAYYPSYNNLGLCYLQLADYLNAEKILLQAYARNPTDPQTCNNLASVYQNTLALEKASDFCRKAIALQDDCANAHYNLSQCRLLLGDYSAGWRSYEWRWASDALDYPPRAFPYPHWKGEALAGKTLLVWGEQGIGDEILFARLLPLLSQMNTAIVVECDHRLGPLVTRSFPNYHIIPRHDPALITRDSPPIDFQLALGSLARQIQFNPQNTPAYEPYLSVDQDRKRYYRECYQSKQPNRQIVGIAWKTHDPLRTSALSDWEALFARDDLTFVNCQHGRSQAEFEAITSAFNVPVLGLPHLDPLVELDDYAASLAALDHVVCIDNAVAHLAGAIGQRVSVALPYVPNWRWETHLDHSPWYPHVQLFRAQCLPSQGKTLWNTVFPRIASNLP